MNSSRIVALKDNSIYSSTPENLEDILKVGELANLNISRLLDCNGSNLLVYPYSFADCADHIGNEILFSLQTTWKNGKCDEAILKTGNVVGFLEVRGFPVAIDSRFTKYQ